MPTGILIGYSIITLCFSWLIFKAGQAMWSMPSVKIAIEKFEVNPSKGTLTEKYFYGWIFPINRNVMKGLASGRGDKFITLWFNASGLLFMFFSFSFTLGIVSMWYANLTG